MNRGEEFIEGWGAAITGTVLVALPLAGWAYRGTLSWMDIVVALIGITALLFAVEDFLRRRQLVQALQISQAGGRHRAAHDRENR